MNIYSQNRVFYYTLYYRYAYIGTFSTICDHRGLMRFSTHFMVLYVELSFFGRISYLVFFRNVVSVFKYREYRALSGGIPCTIFSQFIAFGEFFFTVFCFGIKTIKTVKNEIYWVLKK